MATNKLKEEAFASICAGVCMNYYQAHAILDKVKDGTNYPPQIVT